MGIPSQKYINPDSPPDGFRMKNKGKVKESDLVWSTAEDKYLKAKTFNASGLPVDTFWGIAEKIESN